MKTKISTLTEFLDFLKAERETEKNNLKGTFLSWSPRLKEIERLIDLAELAICEPRF